MKLSLSFLAVVTVNPINSEQYNFNSLNPFLTREQLQVNTSSRGNRNEYIGCMNGWAIARS